MCRFDLFSRPAGCTRLGDLCSQNRLELLAERDSRKNSIFISGLERFGQFLCGDFSDSRLPYCRGVVRLFGELLVQLSQLRLGVRYDFLAKSRIEMSN